MNSRILVLATAALMFAAPLSGAAQAGQTDRPSKASVKQNAKLVKKSIKLNAFILKCALNKNGGCGFKDDVSRNQRPARLLAAGRPRPFIDAVHYASPRRSRSRAN